MKRKDEMSPFDLARKIDANAHYPVYIHNFFYFNSELAQKITEEAKRQMESLRESVDWSGWRCPKCGNPFTKNDYTIDPNTEIAEFKCPHCGWEGMDVEVNAPLN